MIRVNNDFYLPLLSNLCSALTFVFNTSLMKTMGNETSANSIRKKRYIDAFLKQNKRKN